MRRPDLSRMSVAEIARYCEDVAASVIGRERVEEILAAQVDEVDVEHYTDGQGDA